MQALKASACIFHLCEDMSERRIVSFYQTRVIFPVDKLTNDPACLLVAMTQDQVEICRTALGYAHRIINWCDEVIDASSYYLPDAETWDSIEALVDDLEDRLMDTCDLSTLCETLQCVCSSLNSVNSTQAGFLGGTTLVDAISNGHISYEGEEPDLSMVPDEPACRDAQTLWFMVYEYVNEVAIPLADASFDMIIYSAIGFLAGIAGVAEWLLKFGWTVEGIQEAAQALLKSNGASLVDWLLADKQTLICLFYDWFTGSASWDDIVAEIDGGDLPTLCKPFIKTAFHWLAPMAQKISEQSWAQDRVQSGYCTVCELPETCSDFADEEWTITPDIAELQGTMLHIISPGVGLPQVAGRSYSGFDSEDYTVSFYAAGSLEEEHAPFTLSVVFVDAQENALGAVEYNGTRENDDWFAWGDSTGPLGEVPDHAICEIDGVAMTQAWIAYVCIAPTE